MLIGAAGAAGGLAIAAVATDALTTFLLRDYLVRTAFDASPDRMVVALASAAGIGVATLVTAAAAGMATRSRVALAGGTRTVARASRVGRVLVGAQVALAVVLLSHASLLGHSVAAITGADSGFTDQTILTAMPVERVGAYRTLDAAAYYRQALERIAAVPGVAAVAFSTFKPHGGALPMEPVGRAGTPIDDGGVVAEATQVSPGFFATLELPILQGRDFSMADSEGAPRVAIISESLERRLFGAGLGLGRHLRVSRRPEWQDAEVIGIARDARLFDLRGGNTAIAYTPALQSTIANYKFVVARAPEQAARGIQQAVDGLGVEYITRMTTLDYTRGRTILQERVMAALSAFFGALALLLVSVGIYGLLSYVLSLRRKEFGIRLALGAHPARIAAQVASGAVGVTALGMLAGLLATALSAPLLRSVLVGTSPYDPLAIAGAAGILLAAGTIAAVAPAVRAARVQPVAELRRD
jgi:predicted permease